ncbi:hypothetical protein BDN70DRAFT_997355 [Pholiota conissans]|uniref:F-box domain-containing protein n=1 Tax=Pholiota conissans TaxID=109636 RepID=A0A9P5YRS7_9AGAR|nr:hypothetical protein BDN70DRAFT_997355 [Pholiota conissans]
MTDTTFLSLPEDLHINIMAEMDARSLIRCAMTCKDLYETLRSSVVLEYRLQLYFDGLEDSGTSTSSISSRISDLRSYRQAWFRQEWRVLPDTLGFSSRYHNFDSYKVGGGVVSVKGGEYFQVVWLPNSRTGAGHAIEHKFSSRNRDVEFCTDPTQDAIAILEDGFWETELEFDVPGGQESYFRINIHIRTLTTNANHPLANKGILTFLDQSCNHYDKTIHNPKFEFSHDTLVLWTGDYVPRLLIWNWKTGQLLEDFRFDIRTPRSICMVIPTDVDDFGLLGSSDFAFLTRPVGFGTIEIYKLKPSIHLATLHLPSYAQGITVESLIIRSHSNPIHAYKDPRGPFTVNAEEQIYVFEVLYEYPESDMGLQQFSMTISVHQRIFMEYCAYDTVKRKPAVNVPWDVWGPSNSAVDTSFIRIWGSRPSHGQRVLCFPNSSLSTNHIEIRDFTLGAVLAASGAELPFHLGRERPAGVLVRSNTISIADVPLFAEDVVGKLPYVSYSLMLKRRDFDIIMLCEEGIVGIMFERTRVLALTY